MHDDDTREAWRISNETSVPFAEAVTSWADGARTVLTEAAGRYGTFVAAAELAALAQQVAGVKTREPVRNWLPEVLDRVTDACHFVGDPPLVALCVNRDQTVHARYAYAVEVAGLPAAGDLDTHSSLARFQCYQHFGAVIPAGATPVLTPQVAAVRDAEAQRAKPPRAPRSPKVKPARTRAAPAVRAPSSSVSAPAAKPARKTTAKSSKKVEPAPKPLRLCENCFTELPGNSDVCEYCN